MNKKFLSFSILVLFAFSMFAGLVSAWSINDPVNSDNVVGKILTALNFGSDYATVIASLCLLLIIVSALYDILSFTAFESPWVKTVIALAVGLITAVAGGLNAAAVWLLAFAGAYTAFGVGAVIVVAVSFFIAASFFASKLKLMKARKAAKEDLAKSVRARALLLAGTKNTIASAKAAIDETERDTSADD